MAQLFPVRHVMGFISSLILSFLAVTVTMFDVSFSTGMTLLVVTALAQAIIQLVLFMHIGETKDRATLYTNIIYAIFIGIVTIIGSWAVLVWAK